MASKKLEKGSADWQFFQDFWKFRQEYYEPEEKDDKKEDKKVQEK